MTTDLLPGLPLASALKAYAHRYGYRMCDSTHWCGVSQRRMDEMMAGSDVGFDIADRALVLTDLFWWDVWPIGVAALSVVDAFDPVVLDPFEAVAA